MSVESEVHSQSVLVCVESDSPTASFNCFVDIGPDSLATPVD